MKKTQLQWIKEQLDKKGQISRNQCLARYISRLGSYICMLKDKGYKIEGSYKTTKNGRDYVYKLIK